MTLEQQSRARIDLRLRQILAIAYYEADGYMQSDHNPFPLIHLWRSR